MANLRNKSVLAAKDLTERAGIIDVKLKSRSFLARLALLPNRGWFAYWLGPVRIVLSAGLWLRHGIEPSIAQIQS